MARVLLPYRSDLKVQPYADALRSAGIEPLLVHADEGRPLKADGLLLAGGTDVDPALYGAEPEPETETPDKQRDQVEFRLLSEALERDVPVLAIC